MHVEDPTNTLDKSRQGKSNKKRKFPKKGTKYVEVRRGNREYSFGQKGKGKKLCQEGAGRFVDEQPGRPKAMPGAHSQPLPGKGEKGKCAGLRECLYTRRRDRPSKEATGKTRGIFVHQNRERTVQGRCGRWGGG